MGKTGGASRRVERVSQDEREMERSDPHLLRIRAAAPCEVGEHLNIAGHELRSPITPLKMRLQHVRRRLQREGGRERDVDDLSKALYQVERLQQRIAIYFDAAALMDGTFTLIPRLSDLSEAARRIVGIYASSDADRVIRLEDTGETLIGLWDSLRLDVALRELVDNALKYTTGDVTLRLARQGSFARVEVADIGPGMPNSLRAHIFEPYATGYQSNHGLGLGLYVAREIVQLHGGEMGVRSSASGGLLFWLTLPLNE